MPEFSAKWNIIADISDDYKDCADKVDRSADKLYSVSKKLSSCSGSYRQIERNICAQADVLYDIQKSYRKMGTVLSDISDLYWRNENELSGVESFGQITWNVAGAVIGSLVGLPAVSANVLWGFADEEDKKKLVKKAVGSFGVLGKFAGAVWSTVEFVKNGFEGDFRDQIKSTLGMVKDVAGFGAGLKDLDFKKLIGLNSAVTVEGAETAWKKYISKEIGNYAGKSGALKAFSKWTGVVASGVSNIFSNYDEFGEASERMVAETITETVIDVAKDAAIGAAIVAAFGGAPVVAVAAGTAVISWGADVVFKKITKAVTGEEKGVTEFVSDAVLDLAEGAKKVVSNAIGGAAKAVKGWFCAPKFSFGW